MVVLYQGTISFICRDFCKHSWEPLMYIWSTRKFKVQNNEFQISDLKKELMLSLIL